ncbi:hypothetical protein B0H14DRAFT_2580770 [Mycena olivaceomarginata]|nr:hypothetical protein B0H14DRAFT_2580770 [Mycena olivaceomarginata]
MGIELVSEAAHEQCRAPFLWRLLGGVVGSFIYHLRALWTCLTRPYTPRTVYMSSGPLPDCEKGPVDVYQTRAQLIDALKRRDAADKAFEAQVTALLDPIKQHLAELAAARASGILLPQIPLDAAEPAPDLPPAPQIFYGRAHDLDVLVDILAPPRQAGVALLGEPGAGTSALSLSILHRPEIVRTFGARRFLVRSHTHTLAAAVGLHPHMPRPVVLAALAACPRRTLIVLDDLPADDDTYALLTELRAMPCVSLLFTTNAAVDLLDYSAYMTTLHIGPLRLPDARALFRAIADLPASACDEHDHDEALLVDVPVPPAAPTTFVVDLSPLKTSLPPSPSSQSDDAVLVGLPVLETSLPPSPEYNPNEASDDAALVDALLERTRYLPRDIVHLAQRAQYEPLPFLLASCVEDGESGV